MGRAYGNNQQPPMIRSATESTTDIPVTSSNTTTNGIRYTWTVTDNPDITGESNSVDPGQNIGTSIQQTLTIPVPTHRG